MKFFREDLFHGKSLEFRLYSLNVRFHASLQMCIAKNLPHYSLLEGHKQIITFMQMIQRIGEMNLGDDIKKELEQRVDVLHDIISAFELGRELGPHPTYAEYVREEKPPIR